MTANGPTASAAVDDALARIANLQAHGAERFDPVGLRFIEALARRTAARGNHVRAALDCRLANAVRDYDTRFDGASAVARHAMKAAASRFPEATNLLQALFDAADFATLHREIARLERLARRRPLAELIADKRHQVPACADDREAADGAAAPNVRPDTQETLAFFRNTWSRLSLARQLSDALARAPENAGPLNSHHLVLRALTTMRDISPEYLRQFMSHIEALLWLDRAEAPQTAAQKQVDGSESVSKRKPVRRKRR